MKQFGKRILTGVMMVLCALCLVLAACGDDSTVKFEFETNGGTPIEAVSVEKGEKYTLPTPEARGEAYNFEGWFDNAEFLGSPVTEVTAETDMKFYAKWEQLYEIVLDLDGGTLSGAKKIFVQEGASVSEAVKNLVPQKAGWQFGAWYAGESELTPSLQMKAETLRLTARYKVGYTVEIYEQDLDREGYTKADDYVGYEYITATPFAPANVINKKGFELSQTAHEGQKVSGVLTETMANNKFCLYYDRLQQSVTVYPSYPGELAGTPKTYSALFGSKLELPADEFSADGYFLSGWEIQNGGEAKVLRSHYIDTLTVNGKGADPDEITVDGDLEIFAQWSRGYTDMLRGGDIIYLFDEDEGICYLERCGQFFEGEYLKSQKYATFVENNKTLMRGKLKEGYTFIYDNRDRADQVAQLYTLSDGELHSEVQIFFNADDTLRLDDNGKSSLGTYSIDNEDNYRIEFTSGDRQGQTLYIRLVQGQTSDGSNVNLFLMRDDDEYNMPLLQCAVIVIDAKSGQTILVPADQYYIDTPMTLKLDGYGNATMTVGTTIQAFYYRMEGDDLLVVLNRSGRPYASYKLLNLENELCYLYYEEEMDTTFIAADGSTLKLDGTADAVYTPKTGSRVEGYYEYAQSAFGGLIITMSLGTEGGSYTFYAELPAEDAPEGTTPTFEVKSNSYAEYYYTDGEEIYYTPFIVIDNMEDDENSNGANSASVYGYTEEGEFKKVAQGSVTYNRTTQTYHFQAVGALEYPTDIFDDPIDLEGIKDIVFGAGIAQVSNTRMRVSYWYSMTTQDGDVETDTDYTKTYTGTYTPDGGESKEVTIKLVGGFAIVQIQGEEELKIGMCSTDEETKVSTIQVGLTADDTQFYAVLTDGEGEADGSVEFLVKLFGTAGERSTDGVVDENVTFAFDGRGGATLTTKQGGTTSTVTGTVAATAAVEGVEGTVYQFTPTEGGDPFRFILITSGSSTYFIRETAHAETHNTAKEGADTLYLSGFGAATYTVGGKAMSGVYAVVAENIIRLDANGEHSFFRLETGDKFVLIGNEYGEYYFYTNASYDGYILFLNGEGAATLKKAGSESVNIAGTYSKNAQGIYTLDLEFEEGEYQFSASYTGELGEETIDSQKHAAFIVQRTDARHVYVDRSSWHVLTVDDFGNAIRYGTYGMGEHGKYTLITEDLLYYESSADAEDACIYRYENGTNGVGTISMLELEDRGYYTEDLASLRFMKSGFMIFNDTTRYYYDLTDGGDVILYRRDFEKDLQGTNEFGFCPIEIGGFTATLDLREEGFGEKVYYSANGYSIGFKRSETDQETGTDPNTGEQYTYKYPVYMDDGNNHVKAYPLETLTFAPLGSENYSTVGTIGVKGTTLTVTVYREVVEGTPQLYFILQGLRFDIEPTYHGGNEATYKITEMHAVTVVQSNEYLRSEFYSLLLAGTIPSDTYGTITFSNEYGTNGRPLSDDATVTANFLEDSPMYGYSIDGVFSKYDAVTDLYCIDLPTRTSGPESTDGYSYRLYVNLCQTPLNELLALGTTGYDIVAYVRVETLEATDAAGTSYTVTAERVLLSEPMNEVHVYGAGEYFNVKLETGTDTKTEVKHDVMAALSGGVYLISYEHSDPDEEDKITGANAYKLVFAEKDAGQVGEQGAVKYLQSVTVETVDAEVYFSADGESHVEVLKGKEGGADLIVHFYHQYKNYTVTDCTYNETAGAYIVTASNGKRFAVKLTEETKTAEFTEIVTYTAADGSYAEFLPTADGSKSVTLVYFGGQSYTVTGCTYNDATQTYTVTASDKTFSVKVTDEDGKLVEITDVTPSRP